MKCKGDKLLCQQNNLQNIFRNWIQVKVMNTGNGNKDNMKIISHKNEMFKVYFLFMHCQYLRLLSKITAWGGVI